MPDQTELTDAQATMSRRRRHRILNLRQSLRSMIDESTDDATRAALEALEKKISGIDLDEFSTRIMPGSMIHYEEKLFGEKYLDIPGRVAAATGYLSRLGLIDAPAQSILDLGAGGGYFCFAAQAFGHTAIGLEPPLTGVKRNRIDFSPIYEMLGVSRSAQPIQPGRAIVRDEILAQQGRFDWITAIAIMFNHSTGVDGLAHLREPGRRFWSSRNYHFFLEDLAQNYLSSDGKVWLWFNEQLYGPSRTPYTPRPAHEHYLSVGKLIEPFLVSYDRDFGAILDLNRPDAWAKSRAVEFDTLVIHETKQEAATRARKARAWEARKQAGG